VLLKSDSTFDRQVLALQHFADGGFVKCIASSSVQSQWALTVLGLSALQVTQMLTAPELILNVRDGITEPDMTLFELMLTMQRETWTARVKPTKVRKSKKDQRRALLDTGARDAEALTIVDYTKGGPMIWWLGNKDESHVYKEYLMALRRCHAGQLPGPVKHLASKGFYSALLEGRCVSVKRKRSEFDFHQPGDAGDTSRPQDQGDRRSRNREGRRGRGGRGGRRPSGPVELGGDGTGLVDGLVDHDDDDEYDVDDGDHGDSSNASSSSSSSSSSSNNISGGSSDGDSKELSVIEPPPFDEEVEGQVVVRPPDGDGPPCVLVDSGTLWKGFRFSETYHPQTTRPKGWEVTCFLEAHREAGRKSMCRRTRSVGSGTAEFCQLRLKWWCVQVFSAGCASRHAHVFEAEEPDEFPSHAELEAFPQCVDPSSGTILAP
jgi:hypothetical protein